MASLGGREIIEFHVSGELEPGLLQGLPGVKAVDKKNEGYVLKVLSIDTTLPALLAAVEKRQAKLVQLVTRQVRWRTCS